MRLIAIQPILSFPCFVAAVCDSSVVNLDSACSLATFCRALESTWGCRCLRVDYLTFCSGCGGISYRIRCEHFIRVLQATGVKYSSFLAGVIDSAWFFISLCQRIFAPSWNLHCLLLAAVSLSLQNVTCKASRRGNSFVVRSRFYCR